MPSQHLADLTVKLEALLSLGKAYLGGAANGDSQWRKTPVSPQTSASHPVNN